jgi:hypothetical protein
MPDSSDIIAERAFYLEGEETGQPAVLFRLWRPYQPQNDWPRCRYELITKANVQQGGEVPGVDGLDCIIACLSWVGTTIAGWNESLFRGRLRWEASPEGGRGLGLPTIEDHWPHHEQYQAALRWSIEQ